MESIEQVLMVVGNKVILGFVLKITHPYFPEKVLTVA